MITVYEVYSISSGEKVATHLTETSADSHLEMVNENGVRIEKRAAEINSFKSKVAFNERFIGKATGTHTSAAARGGKVRSSHAKDIKRNLTITNLEWREGKLTGAAKVSGYTLSLEYVPTMWGGWTVTGSTKL